MWDELRSVFLDKVEDSNFEFQVSAVEPGGELDDLYLASQTRLSQSMNLFHKLNSKDPENT